MAQSILDVTIWATFEALSFEIIFSSDVVANI
jgi:hypothetical protein